MKANDLPIRRPSDAIPVLEQRYGLRVTRQTLWRWRKRWPLDFPCSHRALMRWFERDVFPHHQWRKFRGNCNSKQIFYSILRKEISLEA